MEEDFGIFTSAGPTAATLLNPLLFVDVVRFAIQLYVGGDVRGPRQPMRARRHYILHMLLPSHSLPVNAPAVAPR